MMVKMKSKVLTAATVTATLGITSLLLIPMLARTHLTTDNHASASTKVADQSQLKLGDSHDRTIANIGSNGNFGVSGSVGLQSTAYSFSQYGAGTNASKSVDTNIQTNTNTNSKTNVSVSGTTNMGAPTHVGTAVNPESKTNTNASPTAETNFSASLGVGLGLPSSGTNANSHTNNSTVLNAGLNPTGSLGLGFNIGL